MTLSSARRNLGRVVFVATAVTVLLFGCGRASDEPTIIADRDRVGEDENDGRGLRELDGKRYVRAYSCTIGGEASTCSEQLTFGPGAAVKYENSFASAHQLWRYTVRESWIMVRDDEVTDLVVFAFNISADRQTLTDRDGAIFVRQI